MDRVLVIYDPLPPFVDNFIIYMYHLAPYPFSCPHGLWFPNSPISCKGDFEFICIYDVLYEWCQYLIYTQIRKSESILQLGTRTYKIWNNWKIEFNLASSFSTFFCKWKFNGFFWIFRFYELKIPSSPLQIYFICNPIYRGIFLSEWNKQYTSWLF